MTQRYLHVQRRYGLDPAYDKKVTTLVAFFACLLSATYVSEAAPRSDPLPDTTAAQLFLIPAPQRVVVGSGRFVFSKNVKVLLADQQSREDSFAAGQLAEETEQSFGFRLPLTKSQTGKLIILGNAKTNRMVTNRLRALKISLPDSLGPEAYALSVTPAGILIAGNSNRGIFYGIQTLRQLIRSNREGNSIPCVGLVDWPTLRYRGWMDDISRGPIPTLDFLKREIKTLSEYKLNFLTLYTENVFKLKSHPELAPADGITAVEVAELAAFAKDYHIELIGNAQSFGHMEHMLATPFYDDIRENAYTVNPATEKTYRFLEEEYAEIAPAYESTLFHINCDEVSGLEAGPSKPMVDSLGVGGVYAYHINRINEIVKKYGKRILMWGDIAADNKEIIPKLPKDLVVISWGYDPRASFDEAIRPFKETGYDFMVAPGVNCWSQVWPIMSAACINISNYVRDGAKLGTMGMMNTAWDDDGENFFNYNWHGMIWGAECSWKPAPADTGDAAGMYYRGRLRQFNNSFDQLFYGRPGVASALFRFDSLRSRNVRGLVQDNGVWNNMLTLFAGDTTEQAWSTAVSTIKESAALVHTVDSLRNLAERNAQTLDYASFAAERVLFSAKKNLTRITLARAMRSESADGITAAKAELADLLDNLHSLKAEYVGLWERENRGWWLDRVLEKYDRLGRQFTDLDKTVFIRPANTLVNGTRSIALRTPFGSHEIRYSTDGSEPTERSTLYSGPFTIAHTALVRARAFVANAAYPSVEKYVLVHKAVGRLLNLNSRYSTYNPAYAAGGDTALVDGLRGSDRFDDGRWQGYQGQDLNIEIDLGAPMRIDSVVVGCLQNSYSWILMPERIQAWVSGDQKNYTLAAEVVNTIDPRQDGTVLHDFALDLKGAKTRYLKIVAKSPGKLPSWHHAAGNDSFMFFDEIIVE